MTARRIHLSRLSPDPQLGLDLPERFFHVHRRARDTYGFKSSLFSARGDVIFDNPYEAYLFLNALRARNSSEAVQNLRASELHAMGIIHEIFHAVIGLYRTQLKPDVFTGALAQARAVLGSDEDVKKTLTAFLESFPPPTLYADEETIAGFLGRSIDGVPNEQWMLEELILLWIGNQNPGYGPIRELVSDDDLRSRTKYLDLIAAMQTYFEAQPTFGPDKQNLIEMLLAPIRASPNSITGQLEWIRERWGVEFGHLPFWSKLLLGIDFVVEEGKWFARHAHGTGGGENLAPATFRGELYDYEPEQFSQDLEWMPKVVMIAKSTFVWLDQLSKRYRRSIATLADIPDEELELLARRGFTALWLIGLWRRSDASRAIKQKMGNQDAVASAYSLYDYEIAPELGGEEAYRILKERAARRGIRLASDMVPNHMGIDSSWVINHPDWLLQSDHPPFPNYRFTGPDLSSDARVGIFIEDGYWNRSDAAVVFKRLDRWTGSERYIYHGNDGTSMPWNDTAQLDYLKSEVREAAVRTIIHVAHKFPIIRFDAAMTLAKKHYQRLWFPPPGTGGAIPSRSQFSMTREEFDRLFPTEFWREVVDRVAAEAPNTLLLAEAFWLMEGYFVRTLGMHRVYNSAFMNMLKTEENANYRLSIRNVLEFNPQILKRHVNFMNNPDEETAFAQFGKDDKYFGVCTVMCTMPGLPMFGHGQVEGFTEKYGMEYKRALRDEEPDGWLVSRHEREIFPLLRRRYLFSDVENFLLYDFVTPGGWVDEDVFAYSNRSREERALVFYHNKFKETRGTVRISVGFLDTNGALTQRSLGDGLALKSEHGVYSIFCDHGSGLEHLRENRELIEQGFEIELQAFKYKVFLDWREVRDSEATPYRRLAEAIGRKGVPSIADALVDLKYRPIHAPFYEAINPRSLEYLSNPPERPDEEDSVAGELQEAELIKKMEHILDGVRWFEGGKLEAPAHLLADLQARYRLGLPVAEGRPAIMDGKLPMTHVFLSWLYADALGAVYAKNERDAARDHVMEAWRLDRVIARASAEAGLDGGAAMRAADLVELMIRRGEDLRGLVAAPFKRMVRFLDDVEVGSFLGVHAYEGILWFKKESWDDLVSALATIATIEETHRRLADAEPRAPADVAPAPARTSVVLPGGAWHDAFRQAMAVTRACGLRSRFQFVLLKRELLQLSASEDKPHTA
jgi:glycosidase